MLSTNVVSICDHPRVELLGEVSVDGIWAKGEKIYYFKATVMGLNFGLAFDQRKMTSSSRASYSRYGSAIDDAWPLLIGPLNHVAADCSVHNVSWTDPERHSRHRSCGTQSNLHPRRGATEASALLLASQCLVLTSSKLAAATVALPSFT